MGFKKPDPELASYLDEMLYGYNLTKKRMFGCPTHFMNGNMMGGVFEDTIFLRFKREDRETLFSSSDEVTNFEPIKGRPMKEYLIIPDAILSQEEFNSLIARSYDYVASLPPKK